MRIQMYLLKSENQLVKAVAEYSHQVMDIHSAINLLGWDQETYMPIGGGKNRANQIATLEQINFRLMTSDEAKRLVDKIDCNLAQKNEIECRFLKIFSDEYHRMSKLDEKLVKELAKYRSITLESWKQARNEDNFKIFEKSFNELVNLKIEEASRYSESKNPYNSLINFWEPGIEYDDIEKMFTKLKKEIKKLLLDYANKNIEHKNIHFAQIKVSQQKKFAKQIASKMHFDFHKGRLDNSIHPFSIAFSNSDVRITSRFQRNDFLSGLLGVIHETGHALYEQGIDVSLNRTLASGGSSYGIHESQALFWEHIIARSKAFSVFLTKQLKHSFNKEFHHISSNDIFKLFNKIEAGKIRVDADELSYHLHIIIRCEIENALMNKKISAKDIPEIWNSSYKENLGLKISNYSEGCLQDIHWAFGGIGYFPTYTLGTLYAASMWNQIQQDIPNINEEIEKGHFLPIVKWHRKQIHQFGKLYQPKELLKNSTNSEINYNDFIKYISQKLQNT